MFFIKNNYYLKTPFSIYGENGGPLAAADIYPKSGGPKFRDPGRCPKWVVQKKAEFRTTKIGPIFRTPEKRPLFGGLKKRPEKGVEKRPFFRTWK